MSIRSIYTEMYGFSLKLAVHLFAAAEGASEPLDIFKFPGWVLSAAEAAGLPLPFAVVGSKENDEVEDDVVPLRHYPWGTCLPLRKEHSDAVFFRCVCCPDKRGNISSFVRFRHFLMPSVHCAIEMA